MFFALSLGSSSRSPRSMNLGVGEPKHARDAQRGMGRGVSGSTPDEEAHHGSSSTHLSRDEPVVLRREGEREGTGRASVRPGAEGGRPKLASTGTEKRGDQIEADGDWLAVVCGRLGRVEEGPVVGHALVPGHPASQDGGGGG